MNLSRRTALLIAVALPFTGMAYAAPRVSLIDWIKQQRNIHHFEQMLRSGANPDETDSAGLSALYHAAMARDPAYVRILLKWHADPNFADPKIKWYPLRGALMAQRRTQFHMLLDAGADPRKTDTVGNNLLHLAAQTNQPDIALELLQRGVPPMTINSQGQTFQRYLFMTPPRLLNARAKAQMQGVIDWLRHHNIPVEEP